MCPSQSQLVKQRIKGDCTKMMRSLHVVSGLMSTTLTTSGRTRDVASNESTSEYSRTWRRSSSGKRINRLAGPDWHDDCILLHRRHYSGGYL